MHLRIGTRRSPLALAQTNYVVSLIAARFPRVTTTLVPITTVADRDRKSEFHEFGMIGVFSQEHEQQLLAGEVDFVVHSLKDLPTTLAEGLVLAGVPAREDPRDTLCGATLADLPQDASLGTGSLRRRAQIKALRPDVTVVPIRGNVGSRLGRIAGEDRLDAVILAEAGLKRLALAGGRREVLDPSLFPYAVSQGALGLEARADGAEVLDILAAIENPKARAEVDAERAMLHALGAGCSLPVGACTVWEGGSLSLLAQVTSADGTQKVVARETGAAKDAEALGRAVAAKLTAEGGGEILEKSFRDTVSHFKLMPP